MDGSPSGSGFSLNEIALKPRAALRRTSAAAISGSNSHGIWQGMDRGRVRTDPRLQDTSR